MIPLGRTEPGGVMETSKEFNRLSEIPALHL